MKQWMKAQVARPWLWLGVALLVSASAAACGAREQDAPTPEPLAADHLGAAAGADVVLVTLDTLRFDALGFAGNERVETPNLDRLAATGRVYPFAHAHNVVTLPSHANILTGLLPHQHGVRDNAGYVLADELPTLATMLAAAGYATGAFVGAFPLDRRFGLARGFEVYDDHYPRHSAGTAFALPERRGDHVVGAALDWWRQASDRPRLVWVHFFDPHAPYEPPEPWASRYRDDPYLGEVAATDAFLEPLLRPFLAGEARPALVVVTSDHGEGLGDHGELTHGLFAYESTLRVPLVLWGPGIEAGADRRQAAHVDILPTLVELLDLDAPPGLAGRSLLGPAPAIRDDPRSVYFEALTAYLNRGWAPLRGVVHGGKKLIDLPQPELYDVKQDPGETVNLIAENRPLARQLHQTLPEEGVWPPDREPVDAAGAAELRSLGYLAATPARQARFGPEDDPKNLIALDRWVHHSLDLFRRGRLAEAEDLARQVIGGRPSMALGYEHLATILQAQERLGDAIAVLRAGVEAGAAGPSLLRRLGLALAEVGEAAEAVRILEPLAAGHDLETQNALAIAYLEVGRSGAARRLAEEVLARDARNVQAMETLGVLALREERPAEALRVLERALEINPELPVAWNSLGVARYVEGDAAGALAAWRQASSLDPSQYDALYNLGLVASRLGDVETARQALRRFLDTAPAARYSEDRERARALLAMLEAG